MKGLSKITEENEVGADGPALGVAAASGGAVVVVVATAVGEEIAVRDAEPLAGELVAPQAETATLVTTTRAASLNPTQRAFIDPSQVSQSVAGPETTGRGHAARRCGGRMISGVRRAEALPRTDGHLEILPLITTDRDVTVDASAPSPSGLAGGPPEWK